MISFYMLWWLNVCCYAEIVNNADLKRVSQRRMNMGYTYTRKKVYSVKDYAELIWKWINYVEKNSGTKEAWERLTRQEIDWCYIEINGKRMKLEELLDDLYDYSDLCKENIGDREYIGDNYVGGIGDQCEAIGEAVGAYNEDDPRCLNTIKGSLEKCIRAASE